MIALLSIAAFIGASIYFEKFRYFWKSHLGTTYGLSFMLFLILAFCADTGSYPDSWLYDQLITAMSILVLAWPLPLIYRFRRAKDRDYLRLKARYGIRRGDDDIISGRENSHAENNIRAASSGYEAKLPKSPKKRARIVRRFSDSFALNLTDEEVDRIVSASFINDTWAGEIAAMSQKYTTPSEWYTAPSERYTGSMLWLRIYMKVFTLQDITSDIGVQHDIAISSLDKLFTYADQKTYSGIAECISDINRKYFTNFDDMTFMLAYRLLESAGKKHKLPNARILKSDRLTDDELTEKYLAHL